MKPLFVIAMIAGLSGCATGENYVPAPQPESDQALVYVYRSSGTFGALVPMKIEIDFTETAKLRVRNYTYTYLSPGKHSITGIFWRDGKYPEANRFGLERDFVGGKTYYFKIGQETEGVAFSRTGTFVTSLDEVPSETALKELPDYLLKLKEETE
jgi:hypothetical protein